MHPDIFLAILNMDSYNRGYGAGITGLPIGGSIGAATIGSLAKLGVNDQTYSNWQSFGFYAQAYRLNGNDILVYRGSDDRVLDVLAGYGTGLGLSFSPQAALALDAAQKLAGFTSDSTSRQSMQNLILSGHSLGGGLAGFVGGLYGSSMVLYDPMMFSAAVGAMHEYAAGEDGEESGFKERIYGAMNPWLPDFSRKSGWYISVQNDDDASNLLDTLRSQFGSVIDKTNLPVLLPDDVDLGWSPTHAVGERHSISLLVIAMVANEQGNPGWISSAKYVAPQLFDDALASRINAVSVRQGTTSNPASVMRDAIAYSAIDEGKMPFGNAAIHAMLGDADDLGRALQVGSQNMPQSLRTEAVRKALAGLVVEYAGLNALHEVSANGGSPTLDGILKLETGSQSLAVNLTDEKWTVKGRYGITLHEVSKDDLISSILSSVSGAGLEAAASSWLAGISKGTYTSIADAVDEITFSLSPGGIRQSLKAQQYQMQVGGDLADAFTITGRPVVFLAGGGADTIVGTRGDDILFGEGDGDTLAGGEGSDWINGGAGNNIIYGDALGGGGGGKGERDAVEYVDQAGALKFQYRGNEATPYLEVVHQGGTDRIYDVEDVYLNTTQTLFEATGSIAAGTELTIHNKAGASSIINAVRFDSGIHIEIRGAGNVNYIEDKTTGGSITIEGFNTEIIATDFDDDIHDMSDEEKIVTAGKGNDIIEVGSGDAVILSGEGFDRVTGGAGDDIVIDLDSAHIESGAGHDTILLGYSSNEVLPGHSVTGGEGNDEIYLQFKEGSVSVNYARGDGNDIFYNSSFDDIETSPSASFAGSIYQPSFNINVTGYSASEVTASWDIEEVRLVAQDAPNYELSNTWLFRGSVTLNFSDGGSIFIQNYASLYQQSPGNPANSPPPTPEYLPFDISVDGIRIPVPLGGGGSARAAASENAQTFETVPFMAALSANGDQDVGFKRGLHSYVGGSGNDRLTITMDPSVLIATLSGTELTISDRWGIIGTTIVSDFDEIYVVSDDRVYTPEAFFDAFIERGESDSLGTEDDDALSGGDGNDQLYGYQGSDELNGFAGQDVLDGGSGADIMAGGAGDDTYYVDDVNDVTTELQNDGQDRVYSTVDIALSANIEDAILRGEAISATGNALDNRLTGNDFDNLLSGGGGSDRLNGGLGNDTLNGGADTDLLSGGEGDDQIAGGDGDDQLLGDAGNDTMSGGLGNDSYYVDSDLDVIVEATGEGTDTIYSTVDFVLPDNVEILHLREPNESWPASYGATNTSGGTIYGNSVSNYLLGAEGVDILFGRGGSDNLFGQAGHDELHGGDDDDALYGEDGDDVLYGGAGSDILEGGGGSDLLVGSGFATLADIGTFVVREAAGETSEFDSVFYYGAREDYVITVLDNGWLKVENSVSSEPEIDYLVNIDEIQFLDPEDPEAELVIVALSGPRLVEPIAEQSLTEDCPFSVAISSGWFELFGGTPVFSLSSVDGGALPEWLSFDGMQVTGTPPTDFNGKIYLELGVQTPMGAASTTLVLDVAAVNDAPIVVSSLSSVEIASDEAFEFFIDTDVFADIDGDELTLTAKLANGDPLPVWLVFDEGAFSGEPPTSFAGVLEIEVFASDGSLSASAAFELTVVAETSGRNILLESPTDVFNYPDDGLLAYSAMLTERSAPFRFSNTNFVHERRSVGSAGHAALDYTQGTPLSAVGGIPDIRTSLLEFERLDGWERSASVRPSIRDSAMWSGLIIGIDELLVDANAGSSPNDGSVTPEIGESEYASGLDQRLAAIVQDMGSFSMRAGTDGLANWRGNDVGPVDFFA